MFLKRYNDKFETQLEAQKIIDVSNLTINTRNEQIPMEKLPQHLISLFSQNSSKFPQVRSSTE
jgi:hypothetical protein